MIIIGEKINGSIPSMGKAIAERNEEWIKDIAKKQADAGAVVGGKGGLLWNIILGLVGGYVGSRFIPFSIGSGIVGSIINAAIGAIVVVLIVRLICKIFK